MQVQVFLNRDHPTLEREVGHSSEARLVAHAPSVALMHR